MPHQWTDEQLAIFEEAKSSDANILIEALAGAAKTSTLVELAKHLRGSVTCLAFNKKIATEMEQRMPKGVQCLTLNSLGHRIWSQALSGRRLQLSDGKLHHLLLEEIEAAPSDERDHLYESLGDISAWLRGSKNHGHVPDSIAARLGSKCSPLLSDEEFFEMLPEEPTPSQIDVMLRVLSRSFDMALEGRIDFADQLLLPTVMRCPFPMPQNVLVDEAQDLSELNHRMLEKLAKRRIIAVGDSCQPAGTLVSVVRKLASRWHEAVIEQVPIEQLTGAETLVGYNGVGAFMFNRTHKPVLMQHFTGELVTITTTSGLQSTYTDSHICYATFEGLRNHYALYLMQQGNKFRIGRCRMEYKSMKASGPTARALAEDADALWILKTFETEREAALEEAVVQAQFGLPDITFKSPGTNGGLASQNFLDTAWAYVCASVDLRKRAERCLDYYHRMIEFPLWEKKNAGHNSLRRPTLVRACNLIDGCRVLPYRGASKIYASEWEEITVTHKFVENEPVYSLAVSDNQLYLADNIVTHNCQAIYAFRGAHTEGMPLLRERFNMETLHLSTTFRCPEAICDHVRHHVPRIRAWADNPNNPGSITYRNTWHITDIPDGSAVLCRNNAPLFRFALRMLRHGRRPNLWGRDVAATLVKVMENLGAPNMSRADAISALARYKTEKEAKMKKASAKQTLAERCECILVFLEAAQSLGGAVAVAREVFNSEGKVDLATGHKAKGAEWDTVFILDRHLLSDEGQDLNLAYVLATRAKRSLTYIDSDGYLA